MDDDNNNKEEKDDDLTAGFLGTILLSLSRKLDLLRWWLLLLVVVGRLMQSLAARYLWQADDGHSVVVRDPAARCRRLRTRALGEEASILLLGSSSRLLGL